MSLAVVVVFAVGTFVEMYLLTVLSGYISIMNTISFVMFTFLIGIIIGRSWGKKDFDKMQWHLRSRSIPDRDALNGSVLAVSSMMLITPGVVTDLIGFLMLIPITRDIFKNIAANMARKRIASGDAYYFFKD